MSASTQNQYDVIYGSWPQDYNEVVLVVDKNNEISDLTLYALGLESMDDISNAMMQSMSKKQIDTTQSSWSYEICADEASSSSSRRRAMWPAAPATRTSVRRPTVCAGSTTTIPSAYSSKLSASCVRPRAA